MIVITVPIERGNQHVVGKLNANLILRNNIHEMLWEFAKSVYYFEPCTVLLEVIHATRSREESTLPTTTEPASITDTAILITKLENVDWKLGKIKKPLIKFRNKPKTKVENKMVKQKAENMLNLPSEEDIGVYVGGATLDGAGHQAQSNQLQHKTCCKHIRTT